MRDNYEKKFWRVEWKKRTVIKVKTFADEGAAKRHFQKFKDAKLTEYLGTPGIDLRVVFVAIAGDF